MISGIKNFIVSYFLRGHSRTVRAKKNVVALFILRGISILINLLLVPLTLNYLNPTKYGIWLTLTSIITWVGVLDIGLGNGLRNKFAEARAKGDHELARTYVSTTYMCVGIICVAALLLFWAANPFLNWVKILNTTDDMGWELRRLALTVFTFFCLRLLFGLIGTILVADQRPAYNSLLEILTNALSLAWIYILTRVSNGSLFWLGFSMSSIGAFVPLAANFWFFRTGYKSFSPALQYVNVSYARELTNLGIQFFILQIAGLLIFSSSNIIITQLFGPAEVTPFNIAFKYYGVASMAFVVILTPFWSAYTEAFVKRDFDWIKRSNKRLKQMWLLLFLAVVVMTLVSNRVYALWVGETIHIPLALSVCMGIYVLIVAWSNIFAYFINGTGKVRLQIWAAIGLSIANIVLAIVLAGTFGLRSTGVVLASCIALLPGCLLWPVQMKKLVSGRATGIWAK